MAEQTRASLLDYLTRDAEQFQAQRTSRILMTGVLTNASSAPAVQRAFIEFVAQYPHTAPLTSHADSDTGADTDDSDSEQPVITGMSFTINNAAIQCLLEAPTCIILSLLNHVHATVVATNAAQLKILSFVEEVPRIYTQWVSRNIRSAVSEEWTIALPSQSQALSLPLPPHTPSPVLTLSFQTLHAMLMLASHVASMPVTERAEFLMSSNSRHIMERVCPLDRIDGFSKCDELMSSAEFLDAFASVIDTRDEREATWPVEQYIIGG